MIEQPISTSGISSDPQSKSKSTGLILAFAAVLAILALPRWGLKKAQAGPLDVPIFAGDRTMGGQNRSVLFWAWLMAAFVGMVLLQKWDQDRELMPYLIFVGMLTTTFFLGVVLFLTNPFTCLWYVPGKPN